MVRGMIQKFLITSFTRPILNNKFLVRLFHKTTNGLITLRAGIFGPCGSFRLGYGCLAKPLRESVAHV